MLVTCNDAHVTHVPLTSSGTLQLALGDTAPGAALDTSTNWIVPFKACHVRVAVAAATVPTHVFVRVVKTHAQHPLLPRLLGSVTTVADYLDAPAALDALRHATTALLQV